MFRQTIKSLLAHKLRLLLTAVAIILGVGFVSGTFVLTDTMNAAFDEVFEGAFEGVDVSVRPVTDDEGPTGEETGELGLGPGVPESLLEDVSAVDGVASANGEVQGYAAIIGSDGEPVGGQGPPQLGVSIDADSPDNDRITDGAAPSGSDEVAIDSITAENEGFAVGDEITVVTTSGRPESYTLSGILDMENLGGASLAMFDLPYAQELFDREGEFNSIVVSAEAGVSQDELAERVQTAVGSDYEAVTGETVADESAADLEEGLSFFNLGLLVFGGVALFVGAFIINNTFSIIIAQRTRELALLRCLGASRTQVRNSVLLESAIVGLVAAVVGLGVGVLLALGLQGVLSAFGIELPSTTPQILPRTLIVALLVGVVVTVVSALVPARKATRVPPVAALREEAVSLTGTRTRLRTMVGGTITAVGVGVLLIGLFGGPDNPLYYVGGGAVVILLGVGALGPLIARPLARVIGWPIDRGLRLPGRLARQNAMRNPKRTAATASALMIGLALVSFVTIFGASLRASIDDQLEQAFTFDYVLSGGSTFGAPQPVSPAVVEDLRAESDLSAVTPFAFGAATIDGSDTFVQAADPEGVERVLNVEMVDGSLADLGEGGIVVSKDIADEHGWSVGSPVDVRLVRESDTLTVAAIHDSPNALGEYLLAPEDYQRLSGDQGVFQVYVDAAEGVAAADARAAVEGVVDAYPTLNVQDQAELREETSGSIDQLLNIFYALLGLSIVIALFGIVNTLVLSILERIRELGLLRAVGMERRQVRSMIRWEAVIIAIMGALLGMVVGTFFGWTTIRALADEGLSSFAIPYGQMAFFLVLAALAGILAAVLPGRRAARIDVLRAIATE
jgi:putative ABC transport system permease protein